jgi:hypothetical protein
MTPEIPARLTRPAVAQDPAAGSTAVPAALWPRHARPGRPQVWLPAAAAGLGVLACAAATVSYAAQYRLVDAARHLTLAAALEAAIPDAAALVFACLGVALALQGRRAVRARLLNVASAGASVFMNVIAAAPGWRNVAVWAMPPAAYALASDTLIGVVRTSTVACHQDTEGPGRQAEVSLLAVLGGLALWLLRLSLAPRSTAAGFRAWVVEECPVAPGRRATRPAGPGRPGDDLPGDRTTADRSSHESHHARTAAGGPPAATGTPSRSRRPSGRIPRGGETKTARFLALVTEKHGPLAGIPVASVARICAVSAPLVGLNTGSARKALRRAVLFAQEQQNEAEEQNSLKGDR